MASKLTNRGQIDFLCITQTCYNKDSTCSLFVFVLTGISEAFEAILLVNFAFEAVAVYSPTTCFNAVNTQSGHVSFVCVYDTVCKCSFSST